MAPSLGVGASRATPLGAYHHPQDSPLLAPSYSRESEYQHGHSEEEEGDDQYSEGSYEAPHAAHTDIGYRIPSDAGRYPHTAGPYDQYIPQSEMRQHAQPGYYPSRSD